MKNLKQKLEELNKLTFKTSSIPSYNVLGTHLGYGCEKALLEKFIYMQQYYEHIGSESTEITIYNKTALAKLLYHRKEAIEICKEDVFNALKTLRFSGYINVREENDTIKVSINKEIINRLINDESSSIYRNTDIDDRIDINEFKRFVPRREFKIDKEKTEKERVEEILARKKNQVGIK